MATGKSGVLNVYVGGGFSATLSVEWSETIGSGYSELAVAVKFSRSGGEMGGTWYSGGSGRITVNGVTVWAWSADSTSLNVPTYGGTSIIAAKTVRVEHSGAIEVPIHVDGASWYNTSYSSLGCSWEAANGTASLGEKQIYTLTITTDENASATVTRNGEAISSGAGLAAGDVLTITGTAQSGYILQLKANDETITSGATLTVNGNVAISAKALKPGAQYVRYVPYIGMPDGWTPL